MDDGIDSSEKSSIETASEFIPDGRFTEGIEYIEDFLGKNPKYKEGFCEEYGEIMALLGHMYGRRFDFEKNKDDLKKAISCYETALPCIERHKVMSTKRAEGLFSLGTLYSNLAELENPKENLDEAIEILEKSQVLSQAVFFYNMEGIMNNLGCAYRQMSGLGSDKEAQKKADESFRALEEFKKKLEDSKLEVAAKKIFNESAQAK